MSRKNNIEVKTICLIKNESREIFVSEGYDSVKKQYFYRPLGGNVEFGERSIDTLKREIREELGEDIINLKLFLILENLFQFEGSPRHEIMFVYTGNVADENFYQKKENFFITESDGVKAKAMWLSIDDCVNGKYFLVPEELKEAIKEL